jgi:Flp pilus assembly secretin CpaC
MRNFFLLSFFCVSIATASLAQTENVSIYEGDGALLRLSGDAASVLVGDPRVASVQAVSARVIYVGGLSVGTTTVSALDFADNEVANFAINVIPDNRDVVAITRPLNLDLAILEV